VIRDIQHRREPSKSYLKFEQVILRSLNLVSLHDTLKEHLGASDPSLNFSDLLRAAVVVAVAAMDAYFTDVFTERLVPFLKKKGATKGLTDLLKDAGMDVEMALQLLSMQRPFRRIRTLVEAHLGQHVTQRTKAINELFEAYGIPGICENVERELKRKRLLREIEILVERRHAIAHDGDLDSHGKLADLNGTWVRNRILDLQKFVATTDEILQNQLF